MCLTIAFNCIILYDTIRYEMLAVDKLMSRSRWWWFVAVSVVQSYSSLFVLSGYKLVMSTYDLSLWHPPRVSESKRPRLQRRRQGTTNGPARFARKLAVNVFTSLSLGPESSTWRLTLLNWRQCELRKQWRGVSFCRLLFTREIRDLLKVETIDKCYGAIQLWRNF